MMRILHFTFIVITSANRDVLRLNINKLKRLDSAVTGESSFFREILEERQNSINMSMSLSYPTEMPYTKPSPSPNIEFPSAIPNNSERPEGSLTAKPTLTKQPVLQQSISPFSEKTMEPTTAPNQFPMNSIVPAPMDTPAILEPSVRTLRPSKLNDNEQSSFPMQKLTLAPTDIPFVLSNVPTLTTIPSITYSTTPINIPSANPTLVNNNDNVVFGCKTDNEIDPVQQSVGSSMTLRFNVGYLVETDASQSDYIHDLEKLIVLTAVSGALQCLDGAMAVTNTTSNNHVAPVNTTKLDEACNATTANCSIYETNFNVSVNRFIDEDVAAFHGYSLLKDNMNDGTFVTALPVIDRCEYLKPFPLLPPSMEDDDISQEIEKPDELSVSPWSLAAVSVMCAGGVFAVAAWYRNRAHRNRMHMELVEDHSVSSPLQS